MEFIYYDIYNSNSLQLQTMDKVIYLFMDNYPFRMLKMIKRVNNSLIAYPTIKNSYLIIEYESKDNFYIGFYNPKLEAFQTIYGNEKDNELKIVRDRNIIEYIIEQVLPIVRQYSDKYAFREIQTRRLFEITNMKYDLKVDKMKNINVTSSEYVRVYDWDIDYIKLSIIPKKDNINGKKGFILYAKPKYLYDMLEIIDNASNVKVVKGVYSTVIVDDELFLCYGIYKKKLPVINRTINPNGLTFYDDFYVDEKYVRVGDIIAYSSEDNIFSNRNLLKLLQYFNAIL